MIEKTFEKYLINWIILPEIDIPLAEKDIN